MLPLDILLPFLAVSFALTLAPGPDSVMVISLGIARGRIAAIAFGVGCALGCLVHTVWVALGAAALLSASPAALLAFKGLGAAYLLYLAFSILRARAGGQLASLDQQDDVIASESAVSYLLKGFMANAINPKVALFFLALLPPFVDPNTGSAGWQVAQLGLLFAVQTIAVFGLLGLFAGSMAQRLKRYPAISGSLDCLAVWVFVLLALTLVVG
jgi:threonine/homoserine/homoserine lactone efflux protein